MDASVVYANLNREPKQASSPSPPPDSCRCPRWHRLALKLGCVGLVLLVLIVIRLSILVFYLPLVHKTQAGKGIQENKTTATESPVQPKCPKDWLQHRNKCIQCSQETGVWKEGLSNCARKGATLLLIQDEEELRFIKDLVKERGNSVWIGLNYSSSDKNWRWINGSTLSSDVLNITGDAKRNSCVAFSKGKVTSESCESDINWICQKELKRL
ncbi:Killer cell lectin-like receptor subfamily B member 1B allele C [Lemmus lemmus]